MAAKPKPAPAGRVTIVDIALAAGVTPSTVSKALNDGRGSAEVRGRVERAAAKLGYRPNLRARGLRRAESQAIGVLVSDLANPAFLPLLRGIEQRASERGYVVLIADGQRNDAIATAALDRFFDQGVDGVIVAGPVSTAALRRSAALGVPIVPTPAPARGVRDPSREWERAESAATVDMASRLVELGHRCILFVAAPTAADAGSRYRRGRLTAMSAVVADAGGRVEVVTVDPNHGEEAAQAVLEGAVSTSDATAVVCGNHLVAPWALGALRQARRRVPRDVSVVVYGDSDWARAFSPPLSVVRRDGYEEGLQLAAAVLARVAGGEVPPHDSEDVAFVERGSCAPARRR